ncbi:MAG: aminopeptidase P family N-terminal domain-containing protein [Actinomycetota bacterium]|nr:aminopeptidase P family N-terminal domain-containing protein [Actinomycetota bacterium]
MRLDPLPESVYSSRIDKLQKQLAENNLDLFIGYSSECESATSRYLTGFWPFFDFDLVLVPAEGKAALVTGGPESYEFAKSFAHAVDIYINPLLVETSAPDWVPEVEGQSMGQIIDKVCGQKPKKLAWVTVTFSLMC